MDCKSCKSNNYKDEIASAFLERANKRLWIVVLVLILSLLITNGLWIYHEMQYEDIVVEQENADGYNNFIGNDGDILNGKAENKD